MKIIFLGTKPINQLKVEIRSNEFDKNKDDLRIEL